jgi:mannose-6-phosphate isomerase
MAQTVEKRAEGTRAATIQFVQSPNLTAPLTFAPIFMERIWGGRRLETEFGKKLPPNLPIGESWEIADRPEAQSIIIQGPLKGKTLHALWLEHRREIFGHVPDVPRFPLLVKLLDARETLSLQVHPPQDVAAKLGGEAKMECWYVAAAEPEAQLYVGLSERMNRAQFEAALRSGKVADHVHRLRVTRGDVMFLPAGRFHAVGAGNLLVEVQQNSDTTYRVFDWNRTDDSGMMRQLHIEQALDCIDFADVRPQLITAKDELLVRDKLFEVQKWNLDAPRQVAPIGQFAIVCCLTGKLGCADIELSPGDFFLVPAQLKDRQLKPIKINTSLLCVTIPV